jgi:hypothetical protein
MRLKRHQPDRVPKGTDDRYSLLKIKHLNWGGPDGYSKTGIPEGLFTSPLCGV